MTISVISSGGGGFGFGLMLLPILIPLSFSALFGLSGLLDYEGNYNRARKLLIIFHILTAIAGVASFFIMPLLPFFALSLPLAFTLISTMTRENIGKKILITNGLILMCLLCLTFYYFVGSEQPFADRMTELWK